MNKKRHKKCSKWIVIALFSTACMTTNVPDNVSIKYSSDSIVTYHNKHGWAYHYLKWQLIPDQALQVYFNPDYYWYYYNSSSLNMFGALYITKQLRKIYIKEISYIYHDIKHTLLTDKTFRIDGINKSDMLVDENDEPILLNGENYYWTSVDFNIKKYIPFVLGFIGQEKEFELLQIYSFDEEELREEKVRYKVICGGIKFDPMRLVIWMYPP